ncbi:tRNA pseudouridine(38-40) synthase TruA [Buchnera aphidicola]|uniref:tRNA pseudouridine synthase A n=1 Tax=Buchnera aphidicola subsp. Tuberolachnus salignus TaxID=98804 RepID=A0A161K9Q6_BUCTT|nr:tRNA pseudouridine(38-40) synthase TruA [Buchnera aphidicola]CUR53119.1 tRNA pseudouridine synthase A [Buchnera aphidicola (Tuberolachnus salignus)]
MKFVCGLQYKGSLYKGWQKQKKVPTIQYYLEKAISIIANHKIETVCAGRTDCGVHSFGQVIHFETFVVRSLKSWLKGINSLLPKDITLLWIKKISIDFNARFSALKRFYRYIIFNHTLRSSFFFEYYYYVYKNLNVCLMKKVSFFLVGEHDFINFQGSQKNSINCTKRRIFKVKIFKINNFIIIDIIANSFLYHMVRNIVGALLLVGLSKKSEIWFKDLIFSKLPQKFYTTVPACGLYLMAVMYPKHFNIPFFISFKRFKNFFF